MRSTPDPRLILTRNGRLAYHIAVRFNKTSILEWLDPSIPLMFLLSGGSGADAGEGGENVLTASVPRLTVIAATVLHKTLMSSLESVAHDLKVGNCIGHWASVEITFLEELWWEGRGRGGFGKVPSANSESKLSKQYWPQHLSHSILLLTFDLALDLSSCS